MRDETGEMTVWGVRCCCCCFTSLVRESSSCRLSGPDLADLFQAVKKDDAK
jgi:hypothetical protein